MNPATLPESRRPVVLVDMDDVLAECSLEIIRIWNRENPNQVIVPGAQSTFRVLDWLKPQERAEELFSIFSRPGFFRHLPAVRGGREALDEMTRWGIEVYLCSTPFVDNPTCADDKLRWVEENLGDYFVHRTILTRDKSLVAGDVLIDDHPSPLLSRKPTWVHVPFAQSYNRKHLGPRLSRWAEWQSVIQPLLDDPAHHLEPVWG